MPSKFSELQSFRRAGRESEYSLRPFDETRSIFFHLPKCAGSSVARTLYGRRVGNKDGSHMTAGWYQLTFDERTYKSYFKFTFTRNPWDRLLSAYRFVKAGGMSEADRAWGVDVLGRFSNFDDFVKRWLTVKKIENIGDGPAKTRVVFAPQYRFVCLRGSSRPELDFVGSFENINSDFQYVAKKIGVETPLSFLNVSNKGEKSYAEEYSDESKAIVAEVYRTDIEMFGYDFDNSKLPRRSISDHAMPTPISPDKFAQEQTTVRNARCDWPMR
jgi:hypothetical protein